MKDFGDWFRDPSRRVAPVVAPVPTQQPTDPVQAAREALEAALDMAGMDDVRITYTVRCRSCDRRYEFIGEIETFEEGVNNYCGGSDRCTP